MAAPALKFEREYPVEEQIARLETKVENIQSDITQMKGDIRNLGTKIDEVDKRLTAKIDEVDKRLTAKIDEVDKRLSAKIDEKVGSLDVKLTGMILALEKSFSDLKVSRANDRVWWLVIAGAILSVMAKGFKWF